jgi:DNA mismatch repair protein MutS2
VARLEDSRRRYEERLVEADERARGAARAEQEADRLLDDLREKQRRRWADELSVAREFVRTLREQGRELLAAIERGAADRRALSRWLQAQEAAIAEHESEIAEQPVSSGPPQIGDQVEVVDTGIRGQLISVEGERARIQRGSLRFEVPAGQLRRISGQAQAPVEIRVAVVPEDTPREITLLGLRAREAVVQLERFLDRAAQAHFQSVRIIHGVGSGALKRAVEEYLSSSPYCAGFRPGDAREGGAGVTIAMLAVG